MHLHCLGTAGYHPNETRHTSCYFLREAGVVLDAGSGMFRLAPLIETDTLDILLTHAHLDHVMGLTFLLDILYQRPVETVRIWGQASKLNAVQEHLIHEDLFPVKLPVSWHEIDNQPIWELAEATMSWRPQTHPGGSVAYRLDWDDAAVKRSIVYATDTTGAEDAETLQWMSRVDVLLHECNFADHQQEWAEKTGHCWLGKVAQVSEKTSPKRVLLTHVNPIDELKLDDSSTGFAMPAEVVVDQQVIDF